MKKKFTRKLSPLARCIKQTGDVVAGTLLYQIQYRFQQKDTLTNRHEKAWVAQTRECWRQETGLTLKQYQRALSILKKKGLVEVILEKFHPGHRWPIAFIRLISDVGHTLHSGSECETYKALDGVPPKELGSVPPKDHGHMASVGITTKEKKYKGIEEEKNFALTGAKSHTISEDGDKEGKDKKNISKKDIEAAWLNAHALIYSDWLVSQFSGTDWHYAGMLLKKLGDDALAVVDAAVANWDGFLSKLQDEHGLYNQGDKPSLQKLANNADVAMNWWIDKKPFSAKEVSEGNNKTDDDCSLGVPISELFKKWPA